MRTALIAIVAAASAAVVAYTFWPSPSKEKTFEQEKAEVTKSLERMKKAREDIKTQP
jgi:hypothetical protein